MDSLKVAIIGGGIGGLTAGFELSKKGYKVTIFEKEKEIGGLLGDFELSGIKIEKTYHHIFKTDKEIITLINELGLQNKLKWHKSSVGLYSDGKMYPFMGAVDLLKFNKLDLVAKFRLGMVYLWLKADKNWQKYEKITAVNWMEKWAGKQAFDVIWKPLLKGKFHEYYTKVSMAWLWARIHTRGGSTNEKGEEVLGYLDGGFGQIIERLAKNLEINEGKIVLQSRIDNIKELEKEFDLIIDTRPIKNIDYIGAVDLVFTSKQSLSNYYWHNINDLNSPFLALIQHTNLIDKENYNGNHVYYLGTYVPQDHSYFKVDDESIKIDFFNYLKKIYPNFEEKLIKEIKIFKFKYAQHIVVESYKVESYKVSDKLYRLNFAQIYPEDRGINFAVKEAKKLVKEIIGA